MTGLVNNAIFGLSGIRGTPGPLRYEAETQINCALVKPDSASGSDLLADNFAGDDDLNATVLLASCERVVVVHGIILAESFRSYRTIG
jgi:hypothetical protein